MSRKAEWEVTVIFQNASFCTENSIKPCELGDMADRTTVEACGHKKFPLRGTGGEEQRQQSERNQQEFEVETKKVP